MDTITHGIIGALIGKAFFAGEPVTPSWLKSPTDSGRTAICAAALGAVFPDIDTFAGPLAHNGLAIMTWHRAITHSLILLPLWAIVLAGITRWLAARLRWPAPRLPLLFSIYAVALASHIFLDLITSFGTMVWSPLSHVRLAWDWLFIVDLSLTSLALAPQLAAWSFQRPESARHRAAAWWIIFSAAAFALIPVTRTLNVPFSPFAAVGATLVFALFFLWPLRSAALPRRTTLNRVGFALIALYIACAGISHHIAFRRVADFARQSGITPQEIAALPLPPSPARWAGMIATPAILYRLELHQFSSARPGIQSFSQAPPNRYIAAARELPDVRTFYWFARFPLVRYSESPDGDPVVLISSMSFYRGPSRRQDSTEPDMANFTFRIVFSPQARVLSHGWVRPE